MTAVHVTTTEWLCYKFRNFLTIKVDKCTRNTKLTPLSKRRA